MVDYTPKVRSHVPSQFVTVGKKKLLRVPRTVNTPINDKRIMPADLEAGMRRLSENFVKNTEYAMERLSVDLHLDVNWRWLSIEAGLSTSTIYTIKNNKANAGTATAVQFARVFGIDPAIMFEPFDRFVILYEAEKTKARKPKSAKSS